VRRSAVSRLVAFAYQQDRLESMDCLLPPESCPHRLLNTMPEVRQVDLDRLAPLRRHPTIRDPDPYVCCPLAPQARSDQVQAIVTWHLAAKGTRKCKTANHAFSLTTRG
jgi:hypothetical protein